jgi:hypothetical protein
MYGLGRRRARTNITFEAVSLIGLQLGFREEVWGLSYFRKSTADQWSITTTKPRMML